MKKTPRTTQRRKREKPISRQPDVYLPGTVAEKGKDEGFEIGQSGPRWDSGKQVGNKV